MKKKEKNPQPAKKSYFFGPGYRDVGTAITSLWKKNAEVAIKYHEIYMEKGLISFSGVYHLFCALSVVSFGSLFSLMISAATICVLAVLLVVVYILFSITWLIDRGYLLHHKISIACRSCMSKYLIPIYVCECGARHTNLTPGVYGIWKRTCNCGRKLPTTFMNGRKKLTAICPECLKEGRVTYLNDQETRPFCVPVIGGRSVGKTAYITAFSKKFIDELAPEKGIDIEFYNDETKDLYTSISTSYAAGSTMMTQKSNGAAKTSSIDFSFFAKHKRLHPDRLMHIYDIAGEVFTQNTENEIPKHYDFSQGIIFMLDPFALPKVRSQYGNTLNMKDKAGIGSADIIGILDSFLIKLRDATGLGDDTISKVPMAVVIGKTDAKGLCDEFSEDKIKEAQALLPGTKVDEHDAMDYLCREFLRNYDAQNFVNVMEMRFKKTRFFTVSAIGHTREEGAYQPQNVMTPMEWICRCSDKSLAAVWCENEFTDTPALLNYKK